MTIADITIDSYLEGSSLESMAEDVRRGLTRKGLKQLPPKYFYDDRGSELFDQITSLPEYYPTRSERALLNRRAPEIVEITGACELLELGSGTASKTRALLFAMAGAGTLERYLPMDVSESVVESCAGELVHMYPGLTVHGVVGDFEQHLEHVPDGRRRLVAFLGGTIGNLYPDTRAAFLRDLRELLGDDGRLVLGTDLVKDVATLEAAYNDSAGVTAEFNLNMLHAINRELDADFDVDSFEHVAFWNETDSWIEMRLRAHGPQEVRIEAADLDLELADGEEIRTEISTKFTEERLEEELAGAGMAVEEFFTDGMFGLTVASSA
ncbi:MAG TPA: L-histidine N(alpha)-methyltransferase [Thermoleophilaceae bacterium]|nr:L-histidine N(alpha)-methyltransferase [Thermoleophilaceae bacterium]